MTNYKSDFIETNLYEFTYAGNIPYTYEEFFYKQSVKDELEKLSNILQKRATKSDDPFQPAFEHVFRALYFTPLTEIKGVILGQDPYPTENAAIGLAFSVRAGNKVNKSLINIYKKLEMDGISTGVKDGNLMKWACSGILLLNTALTVEEGFPGIHSKIWAKFSEMLIKFIAENTRDVHWILLGRPAQSFSEIITQSDKKHKLHCASHPSPMSFMKPCGNFPSFMDSTIFKDTRKYIDWSLA